jgi:hypothetical protein
VPANNASTIIAINASKERHEDPNDVA